MLSVRLRLLTLLFFFLRPASTCVPLSKIMASAGISAVALVRVRVSWLEVSVRVRRSVFLGKVSFGAKEELYCVQKIL